MGKQGKTATNKDNNINIIKAFHYCYISPNMACFCVLKAQNWHKKLTSRACLADLRMHAVTVRIRKQSIYVIKVILLDQPNTCHQSVCFTRIGKVKGTSLKTKIPRFKDSRNGDLIMAPQAGLEPATR